MTIHPRVHAAADAIARHGDRALDCFAALERCDPLADALVEWLGEQPSSSSSFDVADAWAAYQRGDPQAEPVVALFASVAAATINVDWRRLDRARRLFERSGPFGGFVLSLRSLMGGYTAPAGNKPLAMSGRLREQAPRRVAETARFVTAVCARGGMRPGAEGWLICLKVRLMHAQVRRLLWDSGRWDAPQWAAPLNQHDMLATMLLFSEVYVEGLRVFGFEIAAEEAEDWLALWSVVAQLLGTEADLLPRDFAEAGRLRELIYTTQGPPDADSRALAAALVATPLQLEHLDPRLLRLRHGLICALSRMLIGNETADALALADARGWTRALAWVPRAVAAGERVRAQIPTLEAHLRSLGADYWAWVVEASLHGDPARFTRPERLSQTGLQDHAGR